jgi:adenylate cyclase class IV
MLECELKLLSIDKDELLARFESIGAALIGTQLLVDLCLQQALTQTRSRVRFAQDHTVLTMKFKLPTL